LHYLCDEPYEFLKNVNPETVVKVNNGPGDGTTIHDFPSDALNGEMALPPPAGHNPYRTIDGKKYYMPFEYYPTSQHRQGNPRNGYHYPGGAWFTYGPGKGFEPSKPLSPEFLAGMIYKAYDRGATVVTGCGPDHTGLFSPEYVKNLTELGQILKDRSLLPKRIDLSGCKVSSSTFWDNDSQWNAEKMFDDSYYTRWATAADTKDGWVEIDLGEAKRFSKVSIWEHWGNRSRLGGFSGNTKKFELQIEKDGQWQTIYSGTTIGIDYWASFKPVKARQVRLNIIKATDVPSIWEMGLYDE